LTGKIFCLYRLWKAECVAFQIVPPSLYKQYSATDGLCYCACTAAEICTVLKVYLYKERHTVFRCLSPEYCYESVTDFPCHVSLTERKRDLKRFVLDAKPMTTDLGEKHGDFDDKMKVLKNTRIKPYFFYEPRYGDFSREFHVTSRLVVGLYKPEMLKLD
ncbi:hypothetical protein AVEN_181161-1, partial [Araneus ventricosus]